MTAEEEAIQNLRLFVQEHFDGSLSRCLELDSLLWSVRLSKRHEPGMLRYELPEDLQRASPVPAIDISAYDNLFGDQ